MNYSTHIKFIFGALFCCVLLVVMPGCSQSPDEVKKKVDTTAYKIIDSKWDKDFGEKTNFKVSDTEPSSDAIVIDKAIAESGILPLEQAVALATAYNRNYESEKEALYLRAMDLRLIRHEYDMQYFGGIFGLRRESQDGRSIDLDGDSKGIGSVLGFQRLLETGARIGLKLTTHWVELLSNPNAKRSLVSMLSAEIVQPLLRGSNPEIILEPLTQAERDTVYQIRTFNRFRKTFVVDVISRYYRILESKNVVTEAEENYRTLTSIYKRLETLTEAGKLPRHELQQVHQDRLDALNTYVQAKKTYEKMLDEFKTVLSLPTTTEMQLDTEELNTLIANGVPKIDFTEEDAIATAIPNRLDLANHADVVIDAKRHVNVAADRLGMELTLVVGARMPIENSLGGDMLKTVNRAILIERGGNNVTSISLDDMFSVGLDLDLGLDRVAEENEFRKSLLTLARQQRNYEEATDSVVLNVRNAYRNLKEARERYLVQSHSLELAQRRVDNTFLLLQYSSQGNRRANARDVLDAQKDLFNASTDATAALVDYNIAVLEFYRDAGILQVKPDGMWRKVAAK